VTADELMGANAEIDMLRHVIERLTDDTVEATIERVLRWDRADMDMIRAQQEADER
jgi:hypothetical protein